MSIPDFQSTFLPILEYLKDGNVHTNSEIYDALATHFRLSKEEQERLLPSGKQQVFKNRIAWGKSYLKQAGLITSPQRGNYQVTPRGLEELQHTPQKITVKYLTKYPEFRSFRKNGNIGKAKPKRGNEVQDEMSPQEHMEYGYENIYSDLKKDLLDRIKKVPPRFFEKIVIDLLLAMGYGGSEQGAASLTQHGADEGIDGIINEDKLGLDVIYVQAKRWTNNVGRPDIQKFAGALFGKKARKGVYITTSFFSKEAEEYAKGLDTKIILINGERLTSLLIKYNVGVDIEDTYEIKKISLDYFIDT